jgi:polyisoprenyl-phosphate glycosyltransferase
MLSVVLPIYNEQELLDRLWASLKQSLDALKIDWEVVFVDDGSRDGTNAGLRALARSEPRIKVVSLSRNFGNQVSIARGLEYASGDWVVAMDSDLEDRPEDIAVLFKKAQEGFDVVYAVRGSAQKTFLKNLGSKVFYWILGRVADTHLPRHTGNFCIMKRPVVDALKQLPERHRYFAGLRAWVGFSQTGIDLPRAARPAGRPKQSYGRLFLHAFDAIFSFSTAPLKLLTTLGFISFAVSLACAAVVVLMRVLVSDQVPIGWASTILMIIFLGGIQLIGLGILGEYLARIYDEVRGRPSSLVRDVVGGQPR